MKMMSNTNQRNKNLNIQGQYPNTKAIIKK